MNSEKMTVGIVCVVCLTILGIVNGMAMDKDFKSKGLMSDLVQKPIFYSGEMRNVSSFVFLKHKVQWITFDTKL